MNEAVDALAKAMGRPAEEVRTALNDCDLGLVWDPEHGLPAKALMAVHRTEVVRSGAEGEKRKTYWWTLKPLDKGKHTNRSTGEVFKWKT